MQTEHAYQSARTNHFTLRVRAIFMGWLKSLFAIIVRKKGAYGFHKITADIRRKELLSELRTQFGNKVLSGVFKGMIVPTAATWGDADAASKIMGVYESNLHEALQKAIGRTPDAVINVGCAEGFYAIGLARLLPNAEIYAFDIDAKATAVCRHAAEENDVADRVKIGGLCTPKILSEIAGRFAHPCIFMDCEGGEQELLDPGKVPELAYCDIIVETHDRADLDMTATIENRLSGSHEVQRIPQGGRNPNEIKELSRFSETDRWLMVSENRWSIMTWLACWTRLSPRRI